MGKCNTCKGYGYVYESVPYYDGAKGRRITCSACGGSGSDNPCNTCKGYGYVYESVPYYDGAKGCRITCPTCNGRRTKF